VRVNKTQHRKKGHTGYYMKTLNLKKSQEGGASL